MHDLGHLVAGNSPSPRAVAGTRAALAEGHLAEAAHLRDVFAPDALGRGAPPSAPQPSPSSAGAIHPTAGGQPPGAALPEGAEKNPKGWLNEFAMRHWRITTPMLAEYVQYNTQLLDNTGHAHGVPPQFKTTVALPHASGGGKAFVGEPKATKRAAEQSAALAAMRPLMAESMLMIDPVSKWH